MFTTSDLRALPKPELYAQLAGQLRGLIDGEPDAVANMANCSALIFHSIADLNWAGFYLLKGGELVLGPFQGKPACLRIALGRGVCGKAAQQRATLRVDDVRDFADHIACDADSRSEIVVPLISAEHRLIGVLDVDSPLPGRFDADDETGISALAAIMAAKL